MDFTKPAIVRVEKDCLIGVLHRMSCEQLPAHEVEVNPRELVFRKTLETGMGAHLLKAENLEGPNQIPTKRISR